MRANSLRPNRAQRPATTAHAQDDDTWVDRVADEVQALLREHGLEMELCVFFDPVGEYLHAVGFDGSAARYFRPLPPDGATTAPPSEVSRPGMPGPVTPEVSSLS